MITDMTISNFRCFSELYVEPLARVNLFVGMNNAGKTSILDAAELLAVGKVEALARSAIRRGELILASRDERGELPEHVVDPSYLFHGREELRAGKSFSIEGRGLEHQWVHCKAERASSETLIMTLRFESHSSEEAGRLTLSPAGGVLAPPRGRPKPGPRVNFLGTEALDSDRLSQLWDAVVLTPGEEGVTAALRLIEPRIERFALVGEGRSASPRIVLKLEGLERRIPLGNLGGGLRHLFALALNLSSAAGGVLLVDEIDTGLHYTVMADMWRLIIESARRFDIQVFTTTHSLDCVRALAEVREKYPSLAAEVALHRIDKDAPRTVVYTMDEIAVAARGSIEVR